MAKGERPFDIGTVNDTYQLDSRARELERTHTSPLSVPGGARRSGFSKSTSMF